MARWGGDLQPRGSLAPPAVLQPALWDSWDWLPCKHNRERVCEVVAFEIPFGRLFPRCAFTSTPARQAEKGERAPTERASPENEFLKHSAPGGDDIRGTALSPEAKREASWEPR